MPTESNKELKLGDQNLSGQLDFNVKDIPSYNQKIDDALEFFEFNLETSGLPLNKFKR